jgi:hypothetical protein
VKYKNIGHPNIFLFFTRHEIYNLTHGNVRVTTVAVENNTFYILCVCVCVCVCIVDLVIRHAQRMHSIILSSLPGLALSFFATLSHKRNDFRKTFYKRKIYFDFL